MNRNNLIGWIFLVNMYNSCSAARPEFRKGEGRAGALASE